MDKEGKALRLIGQVWERKKKNHKSDTIHAGRERPNAVYRCQGWFLVGISV